jgi:hypothetical protein
MNTFDKICAGGAFVLGIVFLVLGAIGLFTGSGAHFKLLPVLGVLPAFVGWGILRSVWFAWSIPPANGQTAFWRNVNNDEVNAT